MGHRVVQDAVHGNADRTDADLLTPVQRRKILPSGWVFTLSSIRGCPKQSCSGRELHAVEDRSPLEPPPLSSASAESSALDNPGLPLICGERLQRHFYDQAIGIAKL